MVGLLAKYIHNHQQSEFEHKDIDMDVKTTNTPL